MRYLVLLVFSIGVDGEFIKSGLMTTAGNKVTKCIVGPIECGQCEDTERRIKTLGDKYGITLEDNEDVVTNEDNFVYPCGNDFDNEGAMDCIRNFLNDNSKCTPVYGPVLEPVYYFQSTIFYRSINVTLTVTDVESRGLRDAKIIQFYYNKVTGNLVFAIQIPAIRVMVKKAFLSYSRTGKESIVLSDFARGVYRGVIFTAIIPKIPNLRLDLAEIHPYVPDSSVSFVIGPKAFASTDPDVVEGVAAFLASVPVLYQENFEYQSQLLTAVILQTLLCDFGIDPYSV